MGPDLPLFCTAILFGTVMLLNVFGLFDKYLYANGGDNIEVNEELNTYYECIPAWTRKCMVSEEAHLRHVLKAKSFSNENLELMRTACAPEDKTSAEFRDQVMESPENYEILNNPFYQDKFQFTDIRYRNADYEHDLVKIILYMMYIGFVKTGKKKEDLGINFDRNVAEMIMKKQRLHCEMTKRKKEQKGQQNAIVAGAIFGAAGGKSNIV
jgi:hypothetical protein